MKRLYNGIDLHTIDIIILGCGLNTWELSYNFNKGTDSAVQSWSDIGFRVLKLRKV